MDEIKILNNKVLDIAVMRDLNKSLFSRSYNIIDELNFISFFLYAFYINNRNGLISKSCNLMEKSQTRGGKQLSIERFINPNDCESLSKYNDLLMSKSYEKMKEFRHKLIAHNDYQYNKNLSKKLKQIALSDELIYTFVDSLIELVKSINSFSGDKLQSFELTGNQIDNVKELANRFKVAEDINVSSIRQMQKSNDNKSYSKIINSTVELIEILGY